MSIGDEGAVTPSTINEILVGANSSGGSFSKASTSTSGSVGVGEWHHALATFVTTTSRLIYLDGGNSAEDTTLHSSLVFDSITIGYEQDASPGDPWDGGLMWPAVWDRALDADEIAMAAAGVHPTMIAPDALVFFAPLDNAQGYRDWISGAAPTVNGTPVYVDGPHVMSSGGIMVPAQTGGITITDVNTTESWNDGDTGLVITGTGFV